MKLIIASNNAHKIREIKQILGSRFEEILSLREAKIDHETVEDGTTFLENARKKATEIAEISGCCALADDSGICAHALNNEPGVYSARYAGGHGDDEANNQLLIKNLRDKDDRTAHYACAIVLAYPDGSILSAEGEMHGEVIDNPRGENGFGYDPIFFLPEYGMTSAEISPEEKNRISHRAKALNALVEKLDRDERDN
ncbi:MAG: XTP/dITP diphosphatase [Clostridia bacterium]|nr:XTP/dITP diphosphatase [Clostridia bacterium]